MVVFERPLFWIVVVVVAIASAAVQAFAAAPLPADAATYGPSRP